MILLNKKDFGRRICFVVSFGEGEVGKITKEAVDPKFRLEDSEYETEMSHVEAQELANRLYDLGFKPDRERLDREKREEHFKDLRGCLTSGGRKGRYGG